MHTITLTDKTFRITTNPTTGELNETFEAEEHTFDHTEAMKLFIEQSIRGMESNVRADVFKDLKVGEWINLGNVLIRDVQVIEDLPSRPEKTLISHRYIAQENVFTF